MSVSRDELRKLLELVDVTRDQEIDCSELLDRLAGYIERFEPDGPPPPGYEDVLQHLRVCAECFEEFEALYRALGGEDGQSST